MTAGEVQELQDTGIYDTLFRYYDAVEEHYKSRIDALPGVWGTRRKPLMR